MLSNKQVAVAVLVCRLFHSKSNTKDVCHRLPYRRLYNGLNYLLNNFEFETFKLYSHRCPLVLFQSNQIKIDFAGMTCHLGDVQRLSTHSYVNLRDKNDATRWLWYWRDGGPRSSFWRLYEVNIFRTIYT